MHTEPAIQSAHGTEQPSYWSPEVEEYLAENTSFSALPFTLNLLSDARGALFFLDAQLIYAEYRDGTVNSKFVSTEGVRSAFFYEAQDSGWVPQNVRRWGQTLKGRWAVQFTPPRKYDIELAHPYGSGESSSTKLTLTLPALVFMGYGSSYYIWATEGQEFDPHANIYHPPVPNLYGEGAICFGGNTPPEVIRPDLSAGWDLFCRSPFTCAHTKERSRRVPNHICTALYEHVLEHGEEACYPIEDLFPYYMTVDDAIEKITKGLPMPKTARPMGTGMIAYGFTEPEDGVEGPDEDADDEEAGEIDEDEFEEPDETQEEDEE